MRINNMSKLSLMNLMLKQNAAQNNIQPNQAKANGRDVLKISSAAKNTSVSNKTNDPSRNRSIDKSIDLQSYIDKAKKDNQTAIENAGSEIKANNADVYQDNYHAFKNALIDKYSKLAETARSHSDPENYIERKYYDKTCSWYAGDLTDEERQIAFSYERQMLNTGTIKGVKYHDSLFRGIEVNGGAADAARTAFNRQMVNAQIGNILKSNGIELSESSQCTFSVDPYSYYISVSGVDEDMIQKMESALNVGDNGKNLYLHIKHCAAQDGANSSQITEDGVLKYQAYHQVLNFTGLELDKLEEKNGTYYTEDGIDIRDIIDAAIDNSKDVPKTHKQQMKDWIRDMIGRLSANGWNNIKDMVLEIDYIGGSLTDKNQDISFSLNDLAQSAQEQEELTEQKVETEQVEIDQEGSGDQMGVSGKVGINAGKLARMLAAAKTRAQVQAVMAKIQADLNECEAGEKNGMDVDEASVRAAQQLLQQAQSRMGSAENREATPEEEMAAALASIM